MLLDALLTKKEQGTAGMPKDAAPSSAAGADAGFSIVRTGMVLLLKGNCG